MNAPPLLFCRRFCALYCLFFLPITFVSTICCLFFVHSSESVVYKAISSLPTSHLVLRHLQPQKLFKASCCQQFLTKVKAREGERAFGRRKSTASNPLVLCQSPTGDTTRTHPNLRTTFVHTPQQHESRDCVMPFSSCPPTP